MKKGSLNLDFLNLGDFALPERTTCSSPQNPCTIPDNEVRRFVVAVIPGHDDYRVGSDGSVWSKKAGHWKKLTLFRNKDGYLHVKIIPNVKSVGTFRFCKTMLVHRLVLFAFVGEPQSDQVACHNNGIKTDNRLVNLRWGTDYDNAQDYARHKHQIELADYPSEIKFGLYDISWGLWV